MIRGCGCHLGRSVTSFVATRGQEWREAAAPIEGGVLARAESAAILCARAYGLTSADADQLAKELDELKLRQSLGCSTTTHDRRGGFADLLTAPTQGLAKGPITLVTLGESR